MEPNELRKLPPQELIKHLSKVTEEYVAAHISKDKNDITRKRNELFQIYQVMKERGFGDPPKHLSILN